MESLAVLVAIIFLVAIFAGPFAIGLTSKGLKRFLNSKTGLGWKVLEVIRKLLHIFAISMGTLVGFQLIALAVAAGKMIGVLAVLTSYVALRREYFPEFSIVGNLRSGINKKVEQPVFSADGSEIVRTKRSRRNGRSQGNDGHGPEGQH